MNQGNTSGVTTVYFENASVSLGLLDAAAGGKPMAVSVLVALLLLAVNRRCLVCRAAQPLRYSRMVRKVPSIGGMAVRVLTTHPTTNGSTTIENWIRDTKQTMCSCIIQFVLLPAGQYV